MMERKRMKVRRHGARRDPGPEVVDRLVDAVLKGGSERARHLEEHAGSKAEAEVVRLVNAIREVGAEQLPIQESQVDGIMTALRERDSAESASAWRERWIEFFSRDILFVGLGPGLSLGFGLMSLDRVVASAPGNRIAAALVAIFCASVSVLLYRRAVERERPGSG